MNKKGEFLSRPKWIVTSFILVVVCTEQAAYFINPYPLDAVSISIHYLIDICFVFISVACIADYRVVKWPRIYIIGSSILMIGLFVILYALSGYVIMMYHDTKRNFYLSTEGIHHAYRRCLYIMTFTAIYLFQRRSNELDHRARAAERNKKEAEFKTLEYRNLAHRAQSNRHFFANVHTLVRATISSDPNKADRALEIWAEMDNYSHDEIESKGGVQLEKEIKQVDYYIELLEMRFEEDLSLHYQKDFSKAAIGLTIPPFILSAFVENVYKHGYYTDSGRPVIIQITCVGRVLKFYSRNPIAANKVQSSSKIGLGNTRRRLDYLYQDKYCLVTTITEEIFELEFRIEL